MFGSSKLLIKDLELYEINTVWADQISRWLAYNPHNTAANRGAGGLVSSWSCGLRPFSFVI